MTTIAVLRDCDELIITALRSAGDVCSIQDSGNIDPAIHDALIVDWRAQNILLASTALKLTAPVPCIAIIDAVQCIPESLHSGHITDLVTVDDIRSTAFCWRLKQICQSYQMPTALRLPHSPDNALINFAINHLSDWVIVKDLEHRFLLVSDDFSKTVGLSKSEIIGKNDLEIGTSEEAVRGNVETGWPGFWAQDDAVVNAGVAASEENLDWRAFSLNSRYKRTTRVPLRNAKGDVCALLVIAADITDRVHAERHLHSRNVMLRRVTEEKLKAEQHRQTAETAVRAKNKFLAAASHDLRQPLHALGLFLAVLERRTTDAGNLDLITKIRQSSESLNALFNSLLDISRLDAGVVEVVIETFPVNELLVSIRDEFVQLGGAKSLKVSVALTDAVVCTDRVLLERILRNLLQNAITYTDAGSVTVSCTQFDDTLKIDVSDTGSGIPESQHDAIFSEYCQLNSRPGQSTKGLGLGLAIVRKMAQLLDANVQLRSGINTGSCFSLTIPLGDVDDIADVDTPAEGRHLAGKNILLIDDEPDILRGLSLLLTGFLCHTLCADSAEQALKLLYVNDIEPDIMIVDYHLAHGNTGDVAIDLVCQHFKRKIPAIIVTGDTSNERLLEARKRGILLLHKPVDVGELMLTLSQMLEEQRLTTV